MKRRWQATTVSGDVPDALWEAFWRYENALMADDLETLGHLFAPGEDTLRADRAGVRVGHDAINDFHRSRGGAPKRVILDAHVRMITPDEALIMATNVPQVGGSGVVTLWWTRGPTGDWVISAAQVASPAPAVDRSVWRVVGTPLVTATGTGSLTGETVAVKDVFAVRGFAVGAGLPEYLRSAPVADEHAPAVTALLEAGADVVGIAQTDELAYSIAGRNVHYGTPPNVQVPGALPGGSSNGPGAAVALGHASLGLGTDTAGSIRVPASYQGLWGLRSTHGAVDVTGLLPLAPRFDAVGWLAREPRTLRAAAAATLDPATQQPLTGGVVVCTELLDVVDREVREAFDHAVDRLVAEGGITVPELVALGEETEAFTCFRTVQAAEAWATHGDWIERHPGRLGADVAARFAYAKTVTQGQHDRARAGVERIRERLETALAGRVLLLPSTSSAALALDAPPATVDRTRTATLRLTCLAGILRAPAVSVPALGVSTVTGRQAPAGLCLVGPRGTDLALVDLGEQLAQALHLDLPAPPRRR